MDDRKLKYLIKYVSPKVVDHLLSNTTYDSAIAALKYIFVKRNNAISAPQKLANRTQQLGESIDQYIEALKLLAKDCGFVAITADKMKRILYEIPAYQGSGI